MRVQTMFSKLFSAFKSKKKEVQRSIRFQKDEIWIQGFQSGFSKAWDLMAPMFADGVSKAKKIMFDEAYSEAIQNLQPAVEQKIDDLEKYSLRDVMSIVEKREELQADISKTKNEEDKKKLTNQIQALNWVINGDLLPKT
jgi:hypothetical protein